MRMNLVKDGLYEREYYFGRKGNKVSYYKYRWNSDIKKESYASKKLNYPLKRSSYKNFDKLIGTLYSEEERHKLEWAIGAIVTGESKYLQKFVVLYGDPGSGKSTILNIIQDLFEGYYSVFDARALGSSSNVFALEAFKSEINIAPSYTAGHSLGEYAAYYASGILTLENALKLIQKEQN